jgi:hypothetical protein
MMSLLLQEIKNEDEKRAAINLLRTTTTKQTRHAFWRLDDSRCALGLINEIYRPRFQDRFDIMRWNDEDMLSFSQIADRLETRWFPRG